VVLAACGVPVSAPKPIDHDQVPFALLSPTPPTTTSTTSPSKALVPVSIWLIAANQEPVRVARAVPVPATLQAVIEALVGGPSAQDVAAGYSTALPSSLRVLSATTSTSAGQSVAVVDFGSGFGLISGSEQVQAVSQVVFTVATYESLTTGVLFEIDGAPIPVPLASGAVVPGPVYAYQFVPAGVGTTTTTTTTPPTVP